MTTSKRQPVLGTEDHAGRLAASNILRLFSHDPLHKYNTEEVGRILRVRSRLTHPAVSAVSLNSEPGEYGVRFFKNYIRKREKCNKGVIAVRSLHTRSLPYIE